MQSTFFDSQVGGVSVVNHSYTDFPWRLLAYDVYQFFRLAWSLPYVLLPVTPTDSGHMDELALTLPNLFCIAVHAVLAVLQLAFLLSLPFLLLVPIWVALAYAAAFFALNTLLCRLLNGRGIEYRSDERYAPARPEHAHEQWIFLNGVAVGEHWMRSNLNRLALTFGRPIRGVHNRTAGIVFDVIECLVQRNFTYATDDVRLAYRAIKETLYDPRYSRVVFLLHSQGGIEGGLVLDWLLQELPQDLLAKLEVYTFGNAANHFNNPHRHVGAQRAIGSWLRRPVGGVAGGATTSTTSTISDPPAPTASSSSTAANRRPPTPPSPPSPPLPHPIDTSISSSVPTLLSEASSAHPSALTDRAIGHIEHYAHTTDFVALWGVLHFVSARPSSRALVPRFLGRVFARASPRGGHQLCQHYLDGMFPLARDPRTGEFAGCAEEGNAFMESDVLVGADGDEGALVRRAWEESWVAALAGRGDGLLVGGGAASEVNLDVEVHEASPILSPGSAGSVLGMTRSIDAVTSGDSNGNGNGNGGAAPRRQRTRAVKVKDLSRLWQYRNGRSPDDKPPFLRRDGSGAVRVATL